MICPNCNSYVEPYDHFCRSCGCKVEASPADNTAPHQSTYFTENINQSESEVPVGASVQSVYQSQYESVPVMQMQPPPSQIPPIQPYNQMPQPQEGFGHVYTGKKSRLWMVWLIPAVTAVLIAAFVLILYSSSKSKDTKVEDLKLRAENAALEGNLEEASKLIQEAMALNPDYPELKDDESILKKGDKISDALKKVDDLIKQKDYKEALASLNKTDEEIKKDNEVFKKVFSKIVENKKALINVMQLKDNASSMKSIDQLCPVYKAAAAINTPEAIKVSEELKSRIEELAATNTKTALKSKDYDFELEELNFALQYVTGSKKLTDLKNDIQKKKNDYEASLKKISGGILSKEKEITEGDITATVTQPLLDSNGHISGKVVNSGTSKYYNVRVLLKVYDETGNIIDQITVLCSPAELGSNSSITFTYKYNNSSKVYVRPVGLVYIQEEDASYDEEQGYGDRNNNFDSYNEDEEY